MVNSADESPGIMKRMVPVYYLFLCVIGFAVVVVSAYFYGMLSTAPAGTGSDSLILVAASSGGIVIGLLLGVLIGRRR